MRCSRWRVFVNSEKRRRCQGETVVAGADASS
ncbi:MAG: hypothetical protein JWM10_241 [Myxococcaceae bacterium]|nr:hypothetical protein [Myxococcaceae bacterium]